MRARQDIEAIYYLSPVQQGLLFHGLNEPGADPYFYQLGFMLRGELDVAALEAAWQAAVDRHTVLRTAFLWKEVDEPLQVVRRQARIAVEHRDWRGYSEAERAKALVCLLKSDREAGFDFSKAPGIRLYLLQTAAQSFYFTWSHHHILLDGWSVALVLKEVLADYRVIAQGRPVTSLPIRPYRDYIRWLRAQDLAAAEQFWRAELAGFNTPTRLPIKRALPVAADGTPYHEQQLRLTERETEDLRRFASRYRLTLNSLVQGSWALLLSRYSGEADVLFGTTVSGRPTELAGAESMVGLFINTLPVRVHTPDHATVTAWLQALQAQNGALRRYEYTPLAKLQGWSELTKGQPLFESLVVFENYPMDESLKAPLGPLKIDPIPVPGKPESYSLTGARNHYPLSLIALPGAELSLVLSYERRRFDDPGIARMLGHCRELLGAMVAQPEARLSQLSMLTESERRQVVGWSATHRDYPQDRCVHELFELKAVRHPERTAVIFEGASLTYGELNDQAERLAAHLRSRCVGPEVRVGLCVERSVELAVGVLGILKAGGVYVPLEPAFPPARLAFLLADSGARLVLTQTDLRTRLVESQAEVIALDEAIESLPVARGRPPGRQVKPGNLAYVIYTSGSTGTPKGVAVEHRQLANYLYGVLERLKLPDAASLALVSTPAADLGHTMLFGALCSGRCLHLITAACAFDPEALADYMQRHRIDVLKLVPSHLTGLLAAADPARLLPRHCLVLGGEAIPWSLIDKVRALAPDCRIINHYGPTETTVGVLTHALGSALDRQSATVPVGRPLPNSRVYILDRALAPCPIGVPGELYIGGAGLARAYLERPDLTAERFIPDPFTEQRLYRTGDRARYLADGAVEFLGRSDHQVKLRGYRVELGELEAQLRAEPEVREAIALVRETQAQGQQLIAYVVGDHMSLEPETLRARLTTRLPDYLVPSAIMALDALPLGPNGKLDREALPAPGEGAGKKANSYIAPRDEIEVILAEVWAQVLRRERIGVHDNFFALGGDSILSLQIIARAKRRGLQLTPKQLFEQQTIAELAAILRNAGSAKVADQPSNQDGKPFALVKLAPDQLDRLLAKYGAAIEDAYPLSPVQHGMLFHELYAPESGAYFNQIVCDFTRGLDVDAFRRSWQQVIARHALLRTSFAWQDLADPLQLVHRRAELPIDWQDWRERPAPTQRAAYRDYLTADRERGFDLPRAPLMRLRVMRLDEQRYRMIWSLHHLVLDGWCRVLMILELLNCYAKLSSGRAPNQIQPRPYRDYIAWLKQQDLKAAEVFWRRYLKGFSTPTLLAEVCRKDRIPEGDTADYAQRQLELTIACTARLQGLSNAQHVTLNTLVQAAFGILLSRYRGEREVAFGVTAAGRPPELAGAEAMMGVFINTLPLRLRVSPDAELPSWLAQIQAINVDLRQYEHTPLAQVQGWSEVRAGAALFDTLLVFQNYPLDETIEAHRQALGLEITEIRGWTNYPLTVIATPGKRLAFTFSYDRRAFEDHFIDSLAGHLETLLQAMLARPRAGLAELPLLTQDERRQVLIDWNATHTAYPQERLVHELFEAQAARAPDAVALVFEGHTLTYAELNARANRVAYYLRGRGVGPEVLVGVCMERSPELVVALLATLKAGGAYVPIDPEYPLARQRFLIEDSAVAMILTQDSRRAALPPHAANVIAVDREWEALTAQPITNPAVAIDPRNPAYVIYTSGSTGTPKGAPNTHAGLLNRLQWMQKTYRLNTHEAVLQKTPISFDVSVWEFFWPLMAGARLVLARPGGHRDSPYIARLIAAARITTLHFVPSMLRVFLDEPEAGYCTTIKRVICSGEALSYELQQRFFARLPVELHNLYGPTEAAIDVTSWRCKPAHTRHEIPIGRPIANMQLYVLDSELTPAPVGVPGEIYIGGIGVARGYLNRPDLTAARFIPHPFSDTPGARLYRTGDRGRYRADGNIEYLSRLDQQVKLRGFRIEPGEIEAALRAHPGVHEAVVIAREDQGSDPRLVGYVVNAADAAPEPQALCAHLQQTLPEYMVPSAFVFLDKLPLSPNGKLDRQALPAPDVGAQLEDQYIAPRSSIEELLCGIWMEVLGIERVGIHDNFFALGGHSLLATQAISRVRQTLRAELPLRDLFENPTVAELAPLVEAARTRHRSATEAPPLMPVSREDAPPLSFAQRRLWLSDQLEPGSSTYNLTAAVRLEGALDRAALEQSLNALVRRHEILRTVFPTVDGQPVQVIAPESILAVALIDLNTLPKEEREAEVRRLATHEAQQPFDLAKGPLLRTSLLQLGGIEHVLLLTMHHIVSDGWSTGILMREFVAFYEAFAAGQFSPVLPELPIQYADFAHWQRQWLQGEVLEAELNYWKRHLKNSPQLLKFPTDWPRPAVQSYRGAKQAFSLPKALTDRLNALSREQGVTLFMLLLAAFKVTLHYQTACDDIVVGTDVASRNQAEIEKLIGFFVNQLALRTNLSGNPTFRELVGRIRKVTLGAYAHQNLPFETVVEALNPIRNLQHAPLFQVKLVLQNVPVSTLELPGLQISILEAEKGTAELDLLLNLSETAQGFSGWFEYSTDLFKDSTIAGLAGQLATVLRSVAVQFDARLDALADILAREHRRQQGAEQKKRDTANLQKLKSIKRKAVSAAPLQVEGKR